MELELSDHQAKLLSMLCEYHGTENPKIWRRHFGDNNIKEFQHVLSKMTWQEVIKETEINAKFEAFMKLINYSFNIAFPLKLKHRKKSMRNGWITQGIRISSKNLRFLSMIKKGLLLTENMKTYITKYKTVYKRVVKEAKRRENDKFLLKASSKSKAAWQIINKETGRAPCKTHDITLLHNLQEISSPEEVAELFKPYFCNIPEQMIIESGQKRQTLKNYQFTIKESIKSIFFVQLPKLR